MTTQNPCPDADRLLGMLDCELEQIQQTEVAKHVNACDTCQLRLETLVTNGLREDLEFEHLATYLGKKDKEDLDFVLAPEEVGLMTETLLSTTASTWAPISLDFLEPSEERDVLGRLGQYQITDVIGRGGMGVALKARDTQLDRIVAVKVLAPELASNPTARRRFLREARAAAAVSHDHVVTVHAVEPGDLPYLAMEYIDGHSLQQRIDRDGPLKVQEILRVGMQTAYGLAAAHAQGLIHHDIKPSNIMLQNGVERVQITDFGLARAVDDVTITRTGEVRGTPQYMSPEQAQGKSTDQRSDLFSLGAVLYAMCTGRAPFRADSTMGVLHRVCNDAPRPIREVNPDIPAWLVGIIDRLLEKHPDDRYQTAEEVGDVLSGYLAHMQQPTVVPLPEPAPAAQRIKKQDSRRTKWIIGPIVALMLLVSLRLTEATGVTNLAGAVIRIATGEGTLVIEVDDPTIEVSLDGEELSITGAGIQELKLRPGQYQFQARKDGQPVKQELVTITRGGRQVVKVRLESPTIETQGKENTTDYRSTPDGAISEVRRIGREHVKNNWVTGLAFSTNGRHLMCAGRRPEYWDLETGKVTVLELGGDEVGCMSVAVSPDGSLAATGHFFEGLVRLWDLNTGEHVRDLIGHAPQVRSLAFSPDGRNLFSGSHDDKTARLWNVETGKETWRFDCDWPCFGVAFSPQGNTALVSDGSTLRVVAVRTGQEISRTALAIGQIKCADFPPMGIRSSRVPSTV